MGGKRIEWDPIFQDIEENLDSCEVPYDEPCPLSEWARIHNVRYRTLWERVRTHQPELYARHRAAALARRVAVTDAVRAAWEECPRGDLLPRLDAIAEEYDYAVETIRTRMYVGYAPARQVVRRDWAAMKETLRALAAPEGTPIAELAEKAGIPYDTMYGVIRRGTFPLRAERDYSTGSPLLIIYPEDA